MVTPHAPPSAGCTGSALHADGAPQTLWRLLIQHVADKATGVRAKALSCLASLLTLLHEQPSREVIPRL